MTGQIKLERINNNGPHVHRGPLIESLLSDAAASFDDYVRLGGYDVARRLIQSSHREEALQTLEEAGLRGRAGGGYPTAHKWWLVSRQEDEEKYFICNANAGQAGGFKERYLLNTNPRRIVEAVVCGALVVGARTAFIALPPQFAAEAQTLEAVIKEATEAGLIGPDLQVFVYRSLGGYIVGEETALMELIEGKIGRPRTKPPLPTARGVFSKPTAVSNLETLLQAHYILKNGAQKFREQGQPFAPGTLVFSLSGHVKRPGLYELPLGTTLREIIYDHGQGLLDERPLKAVFPGGLSSPVLTSESLDVAMDFDSLREIDSDLGSGAVIVVAEPACMVQIAAQLNDFFYYSSCGKCQPCKDGTQRTSVMLHNLDRIDEKSIDRTGKVLPPSLRKRTLNVISNPIAGVSYTDTAEGLDKIRHLSEFYKYRGDCHHSTEAANSIQTLLRLFKNEFEDHRLNPVCQHEGLVTV